MRHNTHTNSPKYGLEAFEAYYHEYYKGEWEALKDSFVNEKDYVNIVPCTEAQYFIDKASYCISTLCAHIISEKRFHMVLDMCAAPGGKLLALLHRLNEVIATTELSCMHFYANDKSTSRFLRLKHNLAHYFFSLLDTRHLEQFRKNIHISHSDGNLFGKNHKNFFDLVLLDAPCTNDKHVFLNAKEMKVWSKRRCTRASITQTSLLCAAIDACKCRGIVIYVTCSISPEENEMVLSRVKKKRTIHIESIKDLDCAQLHIFSELCIDEVQDGYYVFPHKNSGAGPLFFSIIKKLT